MNGEAHPHTVVIAIGSNMGDKLAHCRFGIDRLGACPGVRVEAVSRFYRTAPVDYLDQDWFVNAAVKIRTRLDPRALLTVLKEIEQAAGRSAAGVRFGPRPLDMDIIFYEDRVVDLPELTIPHPRMHKRRFVLAPICDIDPAIFHPRLKQSVQYLLEKINDPNQIVTALPCDS